MGVWSTVTGGLDHVAGSTDEATGRFLKGTQKASRRQFDDEKGGGAFDMLTPGGSTAGSDADVSDDSWNAPGAQAIDQVVDAAFQRPGELPFVDAEDSVDLPFGSFKNPTGDPNFQGEDRTGFGGATRLKILLAGVAVIAGLWVLRPLLEMAATVTEEATA